MADPTQEEIDAILDAENEIGSEPSQDDLREAEEQERESREAYMAWLAEYDELREGPRDVPEPAEDPPPPPAEPERVYPKRAPVLRRFEGIDQLGADVLDVDALIREPDPEATPDMIRPVPVVPFPPKNQRTGWSQLDSVPVLSSLKLPENCYPKAFFEHYMAYARTPLKTRPEYNWATACALISSVLGREWRLETLGGGDNLMGNLYIALIGESGARKSLTARAMKRCAPAGDIWTAIDARSDIGFLSALAEQPHMLWFLDEAGSLFKKFYTKNFEQMPTALTKLYDGGDGVFKAKSYEMTIENPYLTLITCTIESGLIPTGGEREKVQELFTSGLLGRFLLCAAAEEPGDPMIGPLDEDAAATISNWLTKRRIIAANRPAAFKLSPEAESQLRWYQESRGRAPIGLMTGAWNRAPLWAQKLALIYHVAEGRWPNQLITAETLLQALRVVHHYVLPAHVYVARKALYNRVQCLLDDVVQVLEANPQGVTLTELAQLVGRNEPVRYSALALLDEKLHYSAWLRAGAGRAAGRPSIVVSLEGDGEPTFEALVRERTANGFQLQDADCAPPRGVEKFLEDMAIGNESGHPWDNWGTN